MSTKWYALHTKPHKERLVNNQLRNQQIDTFFPYLNVKPKNPRAAKTRPYFPGYMFVRLNLDELGNNALRWTQGLNGLVRFGGEPAEVPANFINELKKHLEEIEKQGGLKQSSLLHGDRVRIIGGPFVGYEAIFDETLNDTQRVQVLLKFLSDHPQPVQMHVDDVQKI